MHGDPWTYRDETVGDVDVAGFDVEALDGGIGKVDEAGAGRLVVDTGPWIFGRKVVLPAGAIDRIDTADGRVFVARSRDEIRHAPELDERLVLFDDRRSSLEELTGVPIGAGRWGALGDGL